MADQKKVLVLGASPKEARYSFLAATRLRAAGYEVVAVGNRKGIIADVEITAAIPPPGSIHTVTLYLNPVSQRMYYEKILDLRPVRVIFNPGTENREFGTMLNQAGIETEEACTLVLLSTGGF